LQLFAELELGVEHIRLTRFCPINIFVLEEPELIKELEPIKELELIKEPELIKELEPIKEPELLEELELEDTELKDLSLLPDAE